MHLRKKNRQEMEHGGRRGHRRFLVVGANICALTLAIVSLSSLASCASSPAPSIIESPCSPAEAIAHLEKLIPSEMKRLGICGLGIVVANQDGALWSSGFGMADKAIRRPFDSGTISNLASVSKLFTATAIMQLIQEGKLGLDDPVSRYLPTFAPKGDGLDPAKVTIRGLLTHHSGLQSDFAQGFSSGSTRPKDYPRPYARDAELASETTLCAAPGEVMSYSNLGYALLGLVIETVSGEDFPSYVRDHILAPLCMNSSSFLIEARFNGRYACGPAKECIPYLRDMPAASLNASAEDMGRFLAAAIAQGSGAKGGILNPESQAEMWRRQNSDSALDFDFSIGIGYWIMSLPSLPGERLVGHGGDIDNFHSLLLIDPARRLGVFVMVNSLDGIGSFSLAGIATDAIRDFGAAEGFAFDQPSAGTDAPASGGFPAGMVPRISGSYASPNGLLRIVPKGKGVSILASGRWLEGFYRNDGGIGLRMRFLGIELPIPTLREIYFTEENIGTETILAMRAEGELACIARKVVPDLIPIAWRHRFGEWVPETAEPGKTLDSLSLGVDRKSGLFIATLHTNGQNLVLPVRAVSDDALVTLGSGRNLGATLPISRTAKSETLDAFGVKLHHE